MARSAKGDEVDATQPAPEDRADGAAAPETAAPETSDHLLAAQKRHEAATGVADRDREYVNALLIERRGYVVRGLDTRIAQVDEQLAARGYVGND